MKEASRARSSSSTVFTPRWCGKDPPSQQENGRASVWHGPGFRGLSSWALTGGPGQTVRLQASVAYSDG